MLNEIYKLNPLKYLKIYFTVKYILPRIQVFVFHSRYSTIVFGFFSVAVAISAHLCVVVFIIWGGWIVAAWLVHDTKNQCLIEHT